MGGYWKCFYLRGTLQSVLRRLAAREVVFSACIFGSFSCIVPRAGFFKLAPWLIRSWCYLLPPPPFFFVYKQSVCISCTCFTWGKIALCSKSVFNRESGSHFFFGRPDSLQARRENNSFHRTYLLITKYNTQVNWCEIFGVCVCVCVCARALFVRGQMVRNNCGLITRINWFGRSSVGIRWWNVEIVALGCLVGECAPVCSGCWLVFCCWINWLLIMKLFIYFVWVVGGGNNLIRIDVTSALISHRRSCSGTLVC